MSNDHGKPLVLLLEVSAQDKHVEDTAQVASMSVALAMAVPCQECGALPWGQGSQAGPRIHPKSRSIFKKENLNILLGIPLAFQSLQDPHTFERESTQPAQIAIFQAAKIRDGSHPWHRVHLT